MIRTMHKHQDSSQSGFVSIVVAMIIMTILTLITIGFAQIMAREQRQALDRQLSTQAFYAAESGVNDVERAVRSGDLSSFGATCTAPKDISTDGSIKNTCTTYSAGVPDIRFDSVAPNPYSPTVFPIRTSPGTLASLTITFNASNYIGGSVNDFRPSTNTDLPTYGTGGSTWNASTGLMKVYLIPFDNGMSRQSILNTAAYFFLYPQRSAGTTAINFSDVSGANYGSIVPVRCNNTSGCVVTINGISGLAYDDMYMAINTVYQPNDIVIDAVNTSGASQEFRDVQAIVDSTGRTTDVVRRIQVRLPMGDQITAPMAAIVVADPAGSLCKLINTTPFSTTQEAPCTL